MYIFWTLEFIMFSLSTRSLLEVFLGQWLNQSFNAFVNYTNRNAKSPITNKYVKHITTSSTCRLVALSL